MYGKQLMKCDTSVFADEITGQLRANGITCSVNDETTDPARGYGPDPGLAIYVNEEDFDRAKEIVAPLVANRRNVKIWCPKCGSEDVAYMVNHRQPSSGRLIASVILLLAGGLYFLVFLPTKKSFNADFSTKFFDIVAAVALVLGFLCMLNFHCRANYHCKQCGKNFFHHDDRD